MGHDDEPADAIRAARIDLKALVRTGMPATAVLLLLLLGLMGDAMAQQPQLRPPRQDASYLPLQVRQSLVFERSQRSAASRAYRIEQRRARCGQRVEWYMGTDGFWWRSY